VPQHLHGVESNKHGMCVKWQLILYCHEQSKTVYHGSGALNNSNTLLAYSLCWVFVFPAAQLLQSQHLALLDGGHEVIVVCRSGYLLTDVSVDDAPRSHRGNVMVSTCARAAVVASPTR